MTLLGDDLATALTEEMVWYEKFKAYDEVTDETVCQERDANPSLAAMERHQQR